MTKGKNITTYKLPLLIIFDFHEGPYQKKQNFQPCGKRMGGEVGASQYALYLNLKEIPWELFGSVVLGLILRLQETSFHVIAPVELKLVQEVLLEKEDHLKPDLLYLAHVVI